MEKQKIHRMRSQEIRESWGIQPINEWMEWRRREWDEYVAKMDAERFVKILKENIPAGEDLQDVRKEDGAT